MKVQPVSTLEFNSLTAADTGFIAVWLHSNTLPAAENKWPRVRTSGGSNLIATSSITLPNNAGQQDFLDNFTERFRLGFQVYQNSKWQPLALNMLDVYAPGNETIDNKQNQFVVAQYLNRPVVFPANMLVRLFPVEIPARASNTDFVQFTNMSITLHG